jgi:NAD(P)-dependent dehydrogenase (short-subunit alcohol dehydrogenase family)
MFLRHSGGAQNFEGPEETLESHGPRQQPDGSLELPDLTGKTMLVTGASSGIGRAAALRLAAAGATVLAHGRSAEKLAGLAPSLGTEPLAADFVRLAEVRRLAYEILHRAQRLDAILHNAGAFYRRRVLTEDGHESTFQTNYLAPFLLQQLVNDLVVRTPGSRIVVTTSVASRIGRVDFNDLDNLKGRYRPFVAYATTKLESILFVRELRRRLAETTVTATAVHPGAVATRFGAGSMLPAYLYRVPIRKDLLLGYFVSTPDQGAEPLLWLATRPDGEWANALYFNRFVPARPPSPQGDDRSLAQDLWRHSQKMVHNWIEPIDPSSSATL